MAKKIYVLDTNTLIAGCSNHASPIYGFEDNDVVITDSTLQELIDKETAPGQEGYGAREALRQIESVKSQGTFRRAFPLPNGGSFRIISPKISDSILEEFPPGLNKHTPGNRTILSVMQYKKDQGPGGKLPLILVTNTTSMRTVASMCGLTVQEYRNEAVRDDSYTGVRHEAITEDKVEELKKSGTITLDGDPLPPNQYVFLHNEADEKSVFPARAIGEHEVKLIKKQKLYDGCTPKNAKQKALCDALLAPSSEIPLVICKGPAGTGKTYLALAAALENTNIESAVYSHSQGDGHGYRTYSRNQSPDKYDRIIITRANVLSDNDLGALPGELEDKMGPLVRPFFDNLSQILAGEERDIVTAKEQELELLEYGIIQIDSIAYMRGCSFVNTFLIVDEAQNLTAGQALEIISRAGYGTKVVLMGDPNQIDNPKVDRNTNGLSFASERMAGSQLCAQITFEEKDCVRSPLAVDAIKRLKI